MSFPTLFSLYFEHQFWFLVTLANVFTLVSLSRSLTLAGCLPVWLVCSTCYPKAAPAAPAAPWIAHKKCSNYCLHSWLSVVCGNLFISRALPFVFLLLLATKLPEKGKEEREREGEGEAGHVFAMARISLPPPPPAKTNWQLNASQSLQISVSKIFQCVLHFTPMTFYPQSVVVLPQSACRFSLYPQPTFTCVSQTRPRTGLQAPQGKNYKYSPSTTP